MKKLLAYVKADWYAGPEEGTPLGWIVLDINSMCPDVKGGNQGYSNPYYHMADSV